MTVIVESCDDFTLEAYRWVAWAGEVVRIADSAVQVMRDRREWLKHLIERKLDDFGFFSPPSSRHPPAD